MRLRFDTDKLRGLFARPPRTPGRTWRTWLIGPCVLLAWAAASLTHTMHTPADAALFALAGFVSAFLIAYAATGEWPTRQELWASILIALLVWTSPLWK